MELEVVHGGQSGDRSNRLELCNWGERLLIVDSCLLGEASSDQLSLVSVDRAIRKPLDLEHPLAGGCQLDLECSSAAQGERPWPSRASASRPLQTPAIASHRLSPWPRSTISVHRSSWPELPALQGHGGRESLATEEVERPRASSWGRSVVQGSHEALPHTRLRPR
jgi:hypothetical protein